MLLPPRPTCKDALQVHSAACVLTLNESVYYVAVAKLNSTPHGYFSAYEWDRGCLCVVFSTPANLLSQQKEASS